MFVFVALVPEIFEGLKYTVGHRVPTGNRLFQRDIRPGLI